MQILIVQFALTVPVGEYERLAAELAPAFAAVPGLLSKSWLLDAESGTAGGVYLFADATFVDAYLASPLAPAADLPFLTALRVQRYDAIEKATSVTRGFLVARPAVPARRTPFALAG